MNKDTLKRIKAWMHWKALDLVNFRHGPRKTYDGEIQFFADIKDIVEEIEALQKQIEDAPVVYRRTDGAVWFVRDYYGHDTHKAKLVEIEEL